MDWAVNGFRLLGLALLAAWEYLVFKQRYGTRSDTLRAKQIDAATAVIEGLNVLCTSVHPSTPVEEARQAVQQQARVQYATFITAYRTWATFLPSAVNDAVARFLTLYNQSVLSNRGVDHAAAHQQLRNGYLDVLVQVRQSLGIDPFGQATLAVLQDAT